MTVLLILATLAAPVQSWDRKLFFDIMKLANTCPSHEVRFVFDWPSPVKLECAHPPGIPQEVEDNGG